MGKLSALLIADPTNLYSDDYQYYYKTIQMY